MPNRLADATSPYLLQHRDNPVDWYEWGEEAFAEASRRDVPVLLSVGYASCHWCHVMAHESFEDPDTATVMNAQFVNVKVDREERPDVDRIYMDAVQAMTGRGGWPMTVFLTPGGEPFYAGTYFPKTDRGGMPSFVRVLHAVTDAWANKRSEIDAQAGALRQSIATPKVPPGDDPTPESLTRAMESLAAQFDDVHGGFGGAPKFPQAPTLEFLLRAAGRPWAPDAERMLVQTLEAMARGGIHDRLGGGFSRYSVDDEWLVPHFEKMLYDNALLARLYVRAWQVTGVDRFERVARSTLDYLLRDLALPDGGFASGEDADSEGVEGKFYVFSHEEVTGAAGDEDAAVAMQALGVAPLGNFEGRSILHEPLTVDEVAAATGLPVDEVARIVARTEDGLREIRARRVRPGLDDKAVCAWNALAVRALADAGVALDEPRYLDAAVSTARYILDDMRRPDGRLIRSRRGGRGDTPAFCDDYAATAVALFALFEATGDDAWHREAAEITERMIDLFADPTDGLFYATGHDAEELIARPKNVFDNPTPSDNALAIEAMQYMAAFSAEPAWVDRIDAALRGASVLMERYPGGAGHFLATTVVHLAPAHQVAIVGPDPRDLVARVRSRYRPEVFLAVGRHGGAIPLLADKPPIDDRPTAYVCRGFVCDAPTTDPEQLQAALP